MFIVQSYGAAMDLENFASPAAGKLTAYTAVVIFLMRRPFAGLPVSYADYFRGGFTTHLTGIFGGLIWGLGQGATLITDK